MTDLDPELTALQERWSPAWSIWRAQGNLDPCTKIRRPGSYCASRMDDAAGITPFLMARSPVALHVALEAQAVAVESGATSAPEPGVLS
jgi:hypothetical protein